MSDDAETNKFVVPANTVLGPRSFVSFDQAQLGFALSHDGESLFLRSPDGSQMLVH